MGLDRSVNQDAVLAIAVENVTQSRNDALHLLAVADGMGGHAAGERASAVAIAALRDSALGALSQLDVQAPADEAWWTRAQTVIAAACEAATRAVHAAATQSRSDLGTTLVAALARGADVLVANLGDSRAYHLRGSRLERISKDHTLVQRLIDERRITEQEAREHPQSSMLLRALGRAPVEDFDHFRLQLEPGDRLILCSDGLSGMIDDTDIERILLASSNPEEACRALVRAANAAGGEDNVSVLVAWLDQHRTLVGEDAP